MSKSSDGVYVVIHIPILGLRRRLVKKNPIAADKTNEMVKDRGNEMVWGGGLEPLVVPAMWDLLGVALGRALM